MNKTLQFLLAFLVGVGFFFLARAAFAEPDPIGFYGTVGAGLGHEGWAGGSGIWRQHPIPEQTHRDTAALEVGAGYAWKHLAVEMDLHHWWPTGLSGEFVPDANYDWRNCKVLSYQGAYYEGIEERADGVSVSLLPRWPLGDWDIYGRLGALGYRESSHFWQVTQYGTSQDRAVAYGVSFLGGLGVSYDGIGIEYDIVPSMKSLPQPFGGMQQIMLVARIG